MKLLPKNKLRNVKKGKNMTLGGSIFAHNAVQFDYCIAESIASLCSVCDDVVVLDAQSTDNTLDVLMECAKKHNNLRVVTGAKWDCAKNYDRLRILTDIANSHLNTDWVFQLQADEVIHESSFNTIRSAVKNNNYKSYSVRRCNLFGDLNHYLRYDIKQEQKPCSDIVIRLALLKECKSHGDAESLQIDPAYLGNEVNNITIFHYGYVRRDSNHIEKTINMQSWFGGEGSQPDQRVVEMKSGRYEWEKMKEKELLSPIPMNHPKFSKNWAAIRQAEKQKLVD